MKKLYTLFLLLLTLMAPDAGAQGIYQFWGATPEGGADDQGVFFSTRFDGTGITPRKAFHLETPSSSSDNFTLYNGKLYTTSAYRGLLGKGYISEYDPVANTITNRADFATITSTNEAGGKLAVLNNKLYGILDLAVGPGGSAQLYEFDPVSGALTVKATFPYSISSYQMSSLTAYNGKLYGWSADGGANGDGHIYSFDPATNQRTELASFDDDAGKYMLCDFLLYNNRLYGAGKNIMEFNPANNSFNIRASLDGISGDYSRNNLALFNNKIYGGTDYAGSGHEGVIFEFDPATHTVAEKVKFEEIGGKGPMSNMTVYNNRLYGSATGGALEKGVLFEYNPATNVLTSKGVFGNSIGEYPNGTFVVYNAKLYGKTGMGGKNDWGTIFEFTPVNNTLIKKLDFGNGVYNGNSDLVYYLGKIYGRTWKGGNNGSGVIYSYDLATHQFAIRHHFQGASGTSSSANGLLLYNNRIYGVAFNESDGSGGTLFEFNPNNDQFTVRHNFTPATGSGPVATPSVYNGKLYGTTIKGGNTDNGVLYEYNLATSTYTAKVQFSNSFGITPRSQLTLYKNKLYGSTTYGGVHDGGTLFEYNPDANGFIVRYHFSEAVGYRCENRMIVLNDKLYGVTNTGGGGLGVRGTIFSFDPASLVYTKLHAFTHPDNFLGVTGLSTHNNKLYGMTRWGGDAGEEGGVIYEYDPVTAQFTNKGSFTGLNGRWPDNGQLLSLPALVAPGTPGSCVPVASANIMAANANEWVAFTDAEGNAVAEINANGNVLGNVNISFYTHDGETRKDQAGRLYLDRNISIQVDAQPSTPVSLRLYIRTAEFNKLKATAGANINNLTDITIFKNEEACTGNLKENAFPLTSTAAFWGLDYVYTLQVSSFSSFYFASKAYTALPVKLEYFKGTVKTDHNLLQWKGSCTNDVNFSIERSTDGVHFTAIGLAMATQADCHLPFQFKDEHPVAGKAWYRLQMQEPNAAPEYSSIIELNRTIAGSLEVKVLPNPVKGSLMTMELSAPSKSNYRLSVFDMQGRSLLQRNIQVQKGVQQLAVDIAGLPAGTYQLVLQDEKSRQGARFIKL